MSNYTLLLVVLSLTFNAYSSTPKETKKNNYNSSNLTSVTTLPSSTNIKVSIHTDRNYYQSGENIGVVCYTLNQGKLIRDPQGQTDIKISLIKNRISTVVDQIVRSENGICASQISIPKELEDGQYYLKASSQDASAIVPITIGDPDSIEANEEGVVAFYPEGYWLSADVKNKIVVKSMTSNRNPIPAHGIIEDADGKRVAKYQTNSDGIGSFYLTPQANKAYYSVDSNGMKTPLPKVYPNTLAIEYCGAGMLVLRSNQKKQIRAIATINGKVLLDKEIIVDTKDTKVTVPTGELDINGVIHFSAWSASNQMVAQREIYMKESPNLKLSIQTSKIDGYTLVKLKATDGHGKAVVGNFSASICDDNSLIQNNRISLPKMVALNSHIKPRVNPMGNFGYIYTTPNTICLENNIIPFSDIPDINTLLVSETNSDYITSDLLNSQHNTGKTVHSDVIDVYSSKGDVSYIATDKNLNPILRFKTNANGKYILHKPKGVETLYLFPSASDDTNIITHTTYDQFNSLRLFELDNVFKDYKVVNQSKLHPSISSSKEVKSLYRVNGYLFESLPNIDSSLIISRTSLVGSNTERVALYGAKADKVVEDIKTKQNINPWRDKGATPSKCPIMISTIYLTKDHQINNTNILSRNNSTKTRTLYWNPTLKTNNNGEATILIKDSKCPNELFYRIEGVSDLNQYGANYGKLVVSK
ncbi:hypothetical protein OAT16_01145 [Prolixibacteraceae bacterium]|nr:hypothetical protein [Prolixibacteraceae bacterium]